MLTELAEEGSGASRELLTGKVVSQEERIVDPKTGGQKGQKIERYDLIPVEAERQLALVYGGGSKKYEDNNWRKGYAWGLSVGALRRHFNLWRAGEEDDAELTELAGEPVKHLACVMWHAACLMEFQRLDLGTNNIFEQVGLTEAE